MHSNLLAQIKNAYVDDVFTFQQAEFQYKSNKKTKIVLSKETIDKGSTSDLCTAIVYNFQKQSLYLDYFLKLNWSNKVPFLQKKRVCI